MAGVFFPRDEFIRLGLSKPAVDALQKVLAIAAVEADQDALSVIVADLMAALGVAEGEIDALQAAVTAAEAAIAALVLVDVDLQGQIDAIAADALGGTVTSITAGVGLDGGVITGVGTIDLADTAVTAGVYGDASNVPQITVDAQGRITDVVEVAVSGGGGGGGAWTLASTTTITTPVPEVDVTGLSGATDILVYAADVVASVSGTRNLRLSVDNGATFFAGSSDYQLLGGNGNPANASSVVLHITAALGARNGAAEIRAASITGPKLIIGANQGNLTRLAASTSPVDAIRIYNSAGGNLTAGDVYVFTR